jgi:hypothetical protein
MSIYRIIKDSTDDWWAYPSDKLTIQHHAGLA